jgi:hypothetical protein
MSRKSSSHNFVPPVVLSGYVSEVGEDGVVLKALAGVEGVLISGYIETDVVPKDTGLVAVFLTVEDRDGTGKSERATTSKGKGEVSSDIPLGARSKITVSTDCIGAKGVWVSLAIRPNIDDKFMQRIEHHESGVPLPTRTKAATRRP